MKFFRIVIEAAKTYYDEAFNFLLMGTVTVLSCLLVIPGPFAFGGLWALGQRAVRGFGSKWQNYWEGVKEYGWRNFVLVLVILLGYIIGLSNLWFYNSEISPFPVSVGRWLSPLWLILLLLWTGIMFYANAFLVELKEPKLLLILRNSLFMVILHPLTTALLILLTILLLALTVVLPPLIFLTPSFILTLRLTAMRMLIQSLLKKQEEIQDNTDTEKELTEEEKRSK